MTVAKADGALALWWSHMARTPVNRLWTPEEDEQLAELLRSGVSRARLTARFKRPDGAIRKRVRLLGLHWPSTRGNRCRARVVRPRVSLLVKLFSRTIQNGVGQSSN